MSERRDDLLQKQLVSLGSAIAWPPDRDLSAAVRVRLEDAPGRAPRRAIFFPRTAFGIALILIALVAATLVLFPGARSAVADWLGISGIEIRVRETTPTPTTSVESLEDLKLGVEVAFSEAQSAVDFDVRIPDDAGLGTARIFLRESPIAAVSLVYEPNSELPRSEQTEVGLLLTQFRGSYTPELIKKVSGSGIIQPVDIGDAGYWIGGGVHSVLFRAQDGSVRPDRFRLAGNTLIWEEDGISYRLEAELELNEALGIARSLD